MTTVEALLGEVSPVLDSRLALSAADQIFFGDTVLLTLHSNEGPTTSKVHMEHGKGKDHHKKNRKGHGKEHHETHTHHRHDGLHAAVENVKEIVKKALEGESVESSVRDYSDRFDKVMEEVEIIKKENAEIRAEMAKLRSFFAALNAADMSETPAPSAPATAAPAKAAGDDDFDLFGSSDDEVDEEKERIKQERLKAYAEKKAKKPAAVAKSSVILDIKPWDDETNMKEMEDMVRAIEKDGLVWGGGKLIPLAYGIKKLQIICVIEDDKVSVDDLIDRITEDISDHVQSVDIHAFNKI